MDEVAAAADEPRHDAVLVSEAVGAALLGAGPGLAGAARLAVALLWPAKTRHDRASRHGHRGRHAKLRQLV